jgi:hypothetical protein
MLDGRQLSPTHAARLRAINRKYYQRMFEMLDHPPAGETRAGEDASRASGKRPLTEGEAAELEAMLIADVREVIASME